MQGPCEHCGNPMKEFWQTQCMYRGAFPIDPPCVRDAHDDNNRHIGLLLFLLAAVIGGCWYLTH